MIIREPEQIEVQALFFIQKALIGSNYINLLLIIQLTLSKEQVNIIIAMMLTCSFDKDSIRLSASPAMRRHTFPLRCYNRLSSMPVMLPDGRY